MFLWFLRLELSIDNTRVTQLGHRRLQQNTKQEEDFTSCITNLYTRRSGGSHHCMQHSCKFKRKIMQFNEKINYRLGDEVAPANLSLLSPPRDADIGLCRLSPPPISERRQVLPAPVLKTPQRHTPVSETGICFNFPEFIDRQTSDTTFLVQIQAPAGSRCKKRRVQPGEHHFPQGHSWVSYSVPKGDLNYR